MIKRSKDTENQKPESDNSREEKNPAKPFSGKAYDGTVFHVWRDGHVEKELDKDIAARERLQSRRPRDDAESKEPGTPRRRLFVKGDPGTGKVKKVTPPTGHEQHKDLPYRKEDFDTTIRQRRSRKVSPFSVPKPWKSEGLEVQELESDSHMSVDTHGTQQPIEVLFTMGVGKLQPQKLLQRLVDQGIRMVLDMRSEVMLLKPGFAKPRDLAILFKEAANIEYRREEILVPKNDLITQFERDNNIVRFQENYLRDLISQRAETALNRNWLVKNKVAILGEETIADDSLRKVAATYLAEKWSISNVIHL